MDKAGQLLGFLNLTLFHSGQKITLRGDSSKIDLVLCDQFSKRRYKKIVFISGGGLNGLPGSVRPIFVSTPSSGLSSNQ